MRPQRSAIAIAFLLALGIGSATPALAHGDKAKAKSAQAATVEPIPAAEADRDLAQKVASALNADSTFKSSAIQVASNDGKISLDGTEVVGSRITGERRDQSDVRTFRRLDGAHAPVL